MNYNAVITIDFLNVLSKENYITARLLQHPSYPIFSWLDSKTSAAWEPSSALAGVWTINTHRQRKISLNSMKLKWSSQTITWVVNIHCVNVIIGISCHLTGKRHIHIGREMSCCTCSLIKSTSWEEERDTKR